LLVLALACATRPHLLAPGQSTAFGSFRLVPREGVTPGELVQVDVRHFRMV
jgi:hypothetical protein